MPRKVMVATASLRRSGRRRTIEQNLAAAARLLERAAAVQPDLVCLPECFATLEVAYRTASEGAEPLPGPTTGRICALARRRGMYVVCPIVEREGPGVDNSA